MSIKSFLPCYLPFDLKKSCQWSFKSVSAIDLCFCIADNLIEQNWHQEMLFALATRFNLFHIPLIEVSLSEKFSFEDFRHAGFQLPEGRICKLALKLMMLRCNLSELSSRWDWEEPHNKLAVIAEHEIADQQTVLRCSDLGMQADAHVAEGLRLLPVIDELLFETLGGDCQDIEAVTLADLLGVRRIREKSKEITKLVPAGFEDPMGVFDHMSGTSDSDRVEF